MTIVGPAAEAELSGPPRPMAVQPLEEVIRPFATTSRGISIGSIGGDQTRTVLSYQALADQTATAAARLRRSGIGPGALVATTLMNDLPSVLTVLAIWMAGATLVSVPPSARNARDWHRRKFGSVLDALGCSFLIGDEDHADGLAIAAGMRRISKLALAEPGHDRASLPDVTVPDTAMIQFTSGSIGTPKGVAISNSALAGHLAAATAVFQLDGEADRIMSWLPLYHDMGLILMFLTGLAVRADQLLAPPATFATRPASWLTTLAQDQATVTAAPNFAFRLAAAVPYDAPLDLSRMRLCVNGGERVDWQTLLDFHATAGQMGFDWGALMPGYGLAEGTVGVTVTPLGNGPRLGPAGHVSVGVPFPGTGLRVPLAPASAGPVQMRGDWLFRGYHTADGFQPVAAGDWFDTGDAGFAHDGELYVIGRRDEVLTLAGRNVFAEDVESIAYETGGPLIGVCAAFRSPATERFGLMAEANPQLVENAGDARKLGQLVQASVSKVLGTRLDPVLVVQKGVIPRTTSGKVQRARCRTLYCAEEISDRIIAELT